MARGAGLGIVRGAALGIVRGAGAVHRARSSRMNARP
jgi:hypothetical protein